MIAEHTREGQNETIGGCPLLTVETEHMGTRRVQMKGVLRWLFCWACRAGTRHFFPALAALVGPVQSVFPISQQAGQAVVLGRLSLSMCLWTKQRMVNPYSLTSSCFCQERVTQLTNNKQLSSNGR